MGAKIYATKHTANDCFILLDKQTTFFPIDENSIGSELIFKIITINQMTSNSTDITNSQNINMHNILKLTYTANALKPYSVVNITGKKNNDKSIDIQWVRRCRINGELRDFIDVALDEEYEKYEIEIIDKNTIKRTIQINVLNNIKIQKTIKKNDEKK